jgi:hemerythrin-like metal-binding protein
MAIIDRDDRFHLDIEAMDRTHFELVELVNRLEQTIGEAFIDLLNRLRHHTRNYFEQEKRLMPGCGFPALAEHCSEHERVLGELDRFGSRVKRGLIVFGRNDLRHSLDVWFPLHAATMNSALATHLKSANAASICIPVSKEITPSTG